MIGKTLLSIRLGPTIGKAATSTSVMKPTEKEVITKGAVIKDTLQESALPKTPTTFIGAGQTDVEKLVATPSELETKINSSDSVKANADYLDSLSIGDTTLPFTGIALTNTDSLDALNFDDSSSDSQNTSDKYTVVPGDSLSKIAKANNVSLGDLLAANRQITNPDAISIGEVINISNHSEKSPNSSRHNSPLTTSSPLSLWADALSQEKTLRTVQDTSVEHTEKPEVSFPNIGQQLESPQKSGVTGLSKRALEARLEENQRETNIQAIIDNIAVIGTSSEQVSQVLRQELLQNLYVTEGRDLLMAWNVRTYVEQGMTLDEARTQARQDRGQGDEWVTIEPTFNLEEYGFSQDQYDFLINMFISEGASPFRAAFRVQQIATADERQELQERIDVTDFIQNSYGLTRELAEQVIALNRGEIDTIDNYPPEVIRAITEVEIEYMGGKRVLGDKTPWMEGYAWDVDVINNFFSETHGRQLTVHDQFPGLDRVATRPYNEYLDLPHERGPLPSIHTVLDIFGFFPVVGEIADGLNALIYLAEGDTLNAGISAAALIPVAGNTATGARLAGRAQDMAHGLGGVIKGSRVIDGTTVNLVVFRDGSLLKVVELEDGTTAYIRGTADELGESAEAIANATPARIPDAPSSRPKPAGSRNEVSAEDIILGTSRGNMRTRSVRAISADPDHPLRFLLNNNGDNFIPHPRTDRGRWWENSQFIEMGHVTTKNFVDSVGGTERVVLQGTWENRMFANTVEGRKLNASVDSYAVVDIGGIAVSEVSALAWVRDGYLTEEVFSNASRVIFE